MLGTNVRTDSLNKKISFLTILFAGIILYWLWEAQLISYFSFPSKKLPFNNLAEFLEKSDNKVSFEDSIDLSNQSIEFLMVVMVISFKMSIISADSTGRINA